MTIVTREDIDMWDFLSIAGTLGLFGLAALYARFCDRL